MALPLHFPTSVLDLTRVSDLIRSRTYEAFFPLIFTAVVYFLVAWLLTLKLKLLEKRIDPTLRKWSICARSSRRKWCQSGT